MMASPVTRMLSMAMSSLPASRLKTMRTASVEPVSALRSAEKVENVLVISTPLMKAAELKVLPSLIAEKMLCHEPPSREYSKLT